jgi:hypothetical protein
MGLIYLDSCIVIYLAEQHERWAGIVRDRMDPKRADRYGISPLVKCECLVRPLRRGNTVLRDVPVRWLALVGHARGGVSPRGRIARAPRPQDA